MGAEGPRYSWGRGTGREIEDELRLAAGLTALREKAGRSQRDLAERIGVSQLRIAAMERSRDGTIDVLEQYVEALGGRLEVSVVQGRRRTPCSAGTRRSDLLRRSRNVSPTLRRARAHPALFAAVAGIIEEPHLDATSPS